MTALALGVRLGWRRWAGRWLLVALALSVAFVFAAANGERLRDGALAADRTLLGAVFGLALPLFAYFTVGRVTSDGSVASAIAPIARWGGSRRAAGLGALGACVALTSVVGCLLAVVGVAVARGIGDAALVTDALTTGWIGALGGAAYAAALFFGASLGKSGWGRPAVLLGDWVLGSGTTLMATPWPRGHLRNLLGGEAVLSLPQWGSSVALLGITIVLLLAATTRAR